MAIIEIKKRAGTGACPYNILCYFQMARFSVYCFQFRQSVRNLVQSELYLNAGYHFTHITPHIFSCPASPFAN